MRVRMRRAWSMPRESMKPLRRADMAAACMRIMRCSSSQIMPLSAQKRTRLRRSRSCGYRMVLKLSPPSSTGLDVSLCPALEAGAVAGQPYITQAEFELRRRQHPGKCSYQLALSVH